MGITTWNIENRYAFSGEPVHVAVLISRFIGIFLFLDTEKGYFLRGNDFYLRISNFLFLEVRVYFNGFNEIINSLKICDPFGKTGIVYFNSVFCKESLGG